MIFQVFPRRADQPFGGVSICLLGDYGQLPPVMDRPMFDETCGGGQLSEDGRFSFRSFTNAVVLRRVERVRGDSDEQHRFRQLLLNLRDGTVTVDDYRLLASRLLHRQTIEELAMFADAPRLVANHALETAINHEGLLSNTNPVCHIHAVHKPASASKKKSEDAMGLEATIRLAVDAPVMLRSNMWVAAGLTNGSMGRVVGILYDPDKAGPPALPAAVCVEFPQYRGPAWDSTRPKVVPIPVITAKWMERSRLYSRTQVPLTLCYATTIHKSQGWTREKVVLDIGSREFANGLTFVAVSRATSLSGIILHPADQRSAHWPRFQAINTAAGQLRRRAADARITALAAHNISL